MVIKINLPNLKKLSFDIPKINIPKPKIDMKILRTSVGYIHDVIGLVPPLKYAVLGVTLAADLGTNGKATEYLNDNRKSNSTLSLFPGMSLTQKIANDLSDGKSGSFTDNTFDSKKFAINKINSSIQEKKSIFKNSENSSKSNLIKDISKPNDKPVLFTTLNRNKPINQNTLIEPNTVEPKILLMQKKYPMPYINSTDNKLILKKPLENKIGNVISNIDFTLPVISIIAIGCIIAFI